MYTARKARKKAEISISRETEEQLLAAEHCINAAIEEGKMDVYCYKYLGKQAIKKLEELEYRVKNCSTQKEGNSFLISWNEERQNMEAIPK